MVRVSDICGYLEAIAPAAMKMDFDNVGLLVGRTDTVVERLLIALDITHDVVTEALDEGAQLIAAHHPLFFTLKTVTDKDVTGHKIVRLLEGGVSAVCMHTNLDAAHGGVNDALAEAAGLTSVELLGADGFLENGGAFSYGRVGVLKNPVSLQKYLETIKASLGAGGLRFHDAGREVSKVAAVGGSGGSELRRAVGYGCDTFLTGDIKYDVFLEAKELGINLIDGGHFCTENPVTAALERLLRTEFPDIDVIVSRRHGDTARFY